jgi:hypothetical protein
MFPRYLDSKTFGLSAGTTLEQIDEDTLAILIKRKSRIVMTDGKKLLDKAARIRTVRPELHVVLKTTAPVCSKTLQFLEKNNLRVIKE